MRVMTLRRCVSALAAGAVAGALLVLAEHGKSDSVLAHTELPYYADATLRPHWDWLSRRHTVGEFALRDQFDRHIDEHLFDDGPTVVGFFFTACVSVCPVSTELLLGAQRKTRARFLSISVSPQADDAPALRAYAARLGLPAPWRLATGAPKNIVQLAREGFFSDLDSAAGDGLPVHLNRAFLVDRAHHLRGVYDASSASDVVRLQHDLGRL